MSLSLSVPIPSQIEIEPAESVDSDPEQKDYPRSWIADDEAHKCGESGRDHQSRANAV